MLFMYLWIATQIIVEMMPISSSGHLYLLELWFKKRNVISRELYYFLHVPTLIIVSGYFASEWFSFVFHDEIIDIKPLLWVCCADFITGIIFLMQPIVIDFIHGPLALSLSKGASFLMSARMVRRAHHERVNIFAYNFLLGLGFMITTFALFKTNHCIGNKLISSWHMTDALILGFAQAIALLPGISRLALTCLVGCLLGFSLYDAFCLSWLLQVPLMFLAVVKSVASRNERAKLWQLLNLKICLAIIISSGLSWMVFLLVIKIIQLRWWYVFGWYMILPIKIWLGLK